MDRLKQRVLLAVLLGALLPVCTGCIVPLAVGAAAGYGAYTYAHGDLDGVAHATVDQTWRATLVAVDELQFTVHEQHKEATRARLLARQADGTEIRIRLERRSGDFTRINVRVGIFGDEARSRTIIDTIKANL